MIVVQPIGWVICGRAEAIDDNWGATRSTIELDTSFNPDAFSGLQEFSHVEIIFHFHQVSDEEIETSARHPRGNTGWPEVGIFAQRGKGRPNRIGVTVCKLIEVRGALLIVDGLDAIQGTPILDIKPVFRAFLPREEVSEPQWATELTEHYW